MEKSLYSDVFWMFQAIFGLYVSAKFGNEELNFTVWSIQFYKQEENHIFQSETLPRIVSVTVRAVLKVLPGEKSTDQYNKVYL